MSIDRQDVDFSVAAQFRALRDYAEKSGYLLTRKYVDEAENGSTLRPSSPCYVGNALGLESPSTGDDEQAETTNNRMELRAALAALNYSAVPSRVNLYTDFGCLNN